MKRLILLAATSLLFVHSALGAKMVKRTEPNDPGKCSEVPRSANAEGDYVEYVCRTSVGVKRWKIVQEGERFSEGFGTIENIPALNAEGIADTPYEFWGEMKSGKFKPKAVIKRFIFSDGNEPPKLASQLVVFRLLPDGTSCTIGIINPGGGENAAARKLALGEAACNDTGYISGPKR